MASISVFGNGGSPRRGGTEGGDEQDVRDGWGRQEETSAWAHQGVVVPRIQGDVLRSLSR